MSTCRTRRRTSAGVLSLLLGLGLLSSACGGSHQITAPASTFATTTVPTTTATAPGPSSSVTATGSGAPAIPTGAYLGAWVNPDKGSSDSEVAQLPRFESGTDADPAVLNVYTAFDAAAPTSELDAIADKGAIPLIGWGCTSTAAISSGRDDATITAFADSLKSYGHPVFLRWFWEMNLAATSHRACLGSGGAAGFIAAWQHMYTLFKLAGATNVAFVWCPGVSSGLPKLESFFPGTAYVNWYGIDGYARTSADFATIFSGWYGAYAASGKPMIVCETGARPGAQVAYLASVQRELPTEFTSVKGFVYFDASGPNGAWELTTAGLAAFKMLSHVSYFTSRA